MFCGVMALWNFWIGLLGRILSGELLHPHSTRLLFLKHLKQKKKKNVEYAFIKRTIIYYCSLQTKKKRRFLQLWRSVMVDGVCRRKSLVTWTLEFSAHHHLKDAAAGFRVWGGGLTSWCGCVQSKFFLLYASPPPSHCCWLLV